MSLDGLKEWIQENGGESNRSSLLSTNHLKIRRDDNLPPALNISHKPISNIDKLRPSSEFSQRLSSNS